MAYDLTTDPAGRQTVTAFFDDRTEADKARADLLAAGFKDEDIVFRSGADAAAESAGHRSQGILRSLLDIFVFMPPHDQLTYEEGLRRGGVALAVHSDAAMYERAIDILDRDGAVDLDERSVTWKGEGWTPAPGPTRGGGPGSIEQADLERANQHDPLVNPAANHDVRERIGTGTADMTVGTDLDPDSAAGRGAGMAAPTAPVADRGAPEPEPAAERPTLQRDTTHGRVRVRSYVSDPARMPSGIDPQI